MNLEQLIGLTTIGLAALCVLAWLAQPTLKTGARAAAAVAAAATL
jgi:hypothetical protein